MGVFINRFAASRRGFIQTLQVVGASLLLICLLGLFQSVQAQCVTNIDFNTWQQTGPFAGNWSVISGGDSLRQDDNSSFGDGPTMYVSPDTFMNATIQGQFYVEWSPNPDDDWIGFVFSYITPNSTTAATDYEFWLFDWKQDQQTIFNPFGTAQEGFALINIDASLANTNFVNSTYFAFHTHVVNFFDVKQTDYGNGKGWNYNTTYDFSLDLTPNRAVIMINGDTIFDHVDCFQPGAFGFYNFSQEDVIYSGFNYALKTNFELESFGVCLGDTLDFLTNDSSCNGFTGISNLSSWEWDFGDGTTTTGNNPTHEYTSPGTYDVEMIVTDNAGCKDTVNRDVVIFQPPSASFNWNDACEFDSTFFTNSSTAGFGSIATYDWDLGDGTTDNANEPTHLYLADSTYDVQLIITTDTGCVDTVENTINVYERPVPDFDVPNTCFGLNTAFTDQSSAAMGSTLQNWSWDIDSSGSVDYTNTNPSHTYNDTGEFTIQMIVTDNFGCDDSISKTVIIHPKPVASYTSANVCLGDSMHFFDASTGYTSAITSYSYDINDDGAQDFLVPDFSYLYSAADSLLVTLMVETDSGCRDTFNQQMVIYPPPDIGFDFSNVCLNDAANFTDTTQATTGLLSQWQWDFGDASGSSTNQNPSYTYAADGTYTVKLVVTSDTGCADSITTPITVHKLPVPDFTVDNVCLGLPAMPLDASSSVNGFPLTDWWWDIDNDGANDYASFAPQHIYADTGEFTIELLLTDSFGCQDSITQDIVISPGPEPGFDFTNVCLGGPMFFTDTSSISDGSIVAWEWDFGDGTPVDSNQNPQHIYSSAGSYNITFSAVSDSGCVGVTGGQVSIVVFPLPNTSFAAPDVCFNTAAAFSDQSTVTSGNVVAWTWDFGDSSPQNTSQNPNYQYADTGTYTVILQTETNNGCSTFDTNTIEVFPLPEVNYGFTNVCLDNQMQFVDSSTYVSGPIASWDWTFGDGNTSTSQHATHLYGAPGFYNAKLVATVPFTGCKDSLTQTVQVYNLPQVSFSSNNACEDQLINFNDQSTSGNGSPILTWEWDIDEDNVTDFTTDTIIQSFANAGTYNVELKLTDSLGCSDSLSKGFLINPNPSSSFTASDVCLNDQTSFTDNSTVPSGTITNWVWDFGDASAGSSLQNPQYIYGSSGTFTASLLVITDSGCSNISSTPLDVFHNPVIDFDFVNVCKDDQATFTDLSTVINSTVDTWMWNFGDGTTEVIQNPNHLFPVSGNFNVQLTATSAQGCTSIGTESITIYPEPEPNFLSNTVCEGQPYQFSNISTISSGTIDEWVWDFGDGSDTSQSENPIHTYNDVQSYSVELIATSNNGCVDTIIKAITLAHQPVADFNVTDTCAGTPFAFEDISTVVLSSIEERTWDFGDASIPGFGRTPVHTYPDGGFYDVTLTVESSQGCIGTVTKQVEALVAPVVDFNALGVAGCAQYQVAFENLTTIEDGLSLVYEWDFGDTTVSNEREPIHFFPNRTDDPIFYDVSLKVTTINGCHNTVTKPELVYVLPEAIADFDILPNPASVFNPEIKFVDQSFSVNDLYWDFGDGEFDSFVSNPGHTYAKAGTYDVTLSITNLFGCTDTITKEVIVDAVTTIYVPNAFTPNGDGDNDFFFAQGESQEKEYQMRIYNRHGSLIYQESGTDAKWDGIMENGVPAPQGTYVYRISFKDITDADQTLVGSFTLIRSRN